jgi:hypothetical protein
MLVWLNSRLHNIYCHWLLRGGRHYCCAKISSALLQILACIACRYHQCPMHYLENIVGCLFFLMLAWSSSNFKYLPCKRVNFFGFVISFLLNSMLDCHNMFSSHINRQGSNYKQWDCISYNVWMHCIYWVSQAISFRF